MPIDRYRTARHRFHEFRREADALRLIGLALGFEALTGVAAQIRLPLPITPVHITLQTFSVLLAGIVLGARIGGTSPALYVVVGVGGVPWFTGDGAGLSHLLGPAGGYIVGFVAAAVAVGYVTDRFGAARELPALLAVLFVANFVVIYGSGLPWLYAGLTFVNGTSVSLWEVLTLGLLPFVPGDIVKLLGPTAVGRAVSPSESIPHAGRSPPL